MELQEKADSLLQKRKLKTRNDGSTYIVYDNKTDEELNVIMTAHLGRMPNDISYTFIDNILHIIAECETEEEVRDRIYEIEPDVYTSDLTGWLASDNRNVSYIGEVLFEYGADLNGFQLLAMAQHKFIIETGEALISALSEMH